MRARLWEVGHGKALHKTLMTHAIGVVSDRGKFTLSACGLADLQGNVPAW